eukprot:1843883-Lingulodinium_polyedra.AAC.1
MSTAPKRDRTLHCRRPSGRGAAVGVDSYRAVVLDTTVRSDSSPSHGEVREELGRAATAAIAPQGVTQYACPG